MSRESELQEFRDWLASSGWICTAVDGDLVTIKWIGRSKKNIIPWQSRRAPKAAIRATFERESAEPS